jgi:hypothetical protein
MLLFLHDQLLFTMLLLVLKENPSVKQQGDDTMGSESFHLDRAQAMYSRTQRIMFHTVPRSHSRSHANTDLDKTNKAWTSVSTDEGCIILHFVLS